MYSDLCSQHYGKPLTEGISFGPPKLLPADLETSGGKAQMAAWNSKKELCAKWYPVLFPTQDDYTRWKNVDGSVMSHVVAEMCTLRDISFCEVITLPMHALKRFVCCSIVHLLVYVFFLAIIAAVVLYGVLKYINRAVIAAYVSGRASSGRTPGTPTWSSSSGKN